MQIGVIIRKSYQVPLSEQIVLKQNFFFNGFSEDYVHYMESYKTLVNGKIRYT